MRRIQQISAVEECVISNSTYVFGCVLDVCVIVVVDWIDKVGLFGMAC